MEVLPFDAQALATKEMLQNDYDQNIKENECEL
jgi:hypothetical protein